VAPVLLRQLIQYASQYKSEARKTYLLAGADAAMNQTLEQLQIDLTPQADAFDPAGLLILNHPAGSWKQLPLPALKQALEAGMTLYIHDLPIDDPDARAALEALGCKSPAAIDNSAVEQPMHLITNTPLTWGISSQDLYWYNLKATDWIKPPLPITARGVKLEGEHQSPLSFGLLTEVPIGRGRIIIDQVPWQNAGGNEAAASRYLRALMANLGARKR